MRLTSFTIGVDRRRPSPSRRARRACTRFSLSLAKAKVSRAGLGTNVSGVAVKLSAKGAAALNGAFGVKAFTRGLRIGTATVKATPAQIAFTGGATSLALDPGTAQALTALGIAAAPAAPATASPDGSLAFPITAGKVNAKSLAGSITHSGGLTLTKGSTAVTVTDFTIETAPAPKLTALLGTTRFDLATLDLERGQDDDLRALGDRRSRRREAHQGRRRRPQPGVRYDRVHRGPDHRHRHGGRHRRLDPRRRAPGPAQIAGSGASRTATRSALMRASCGT